jgi:hypothetical protein
MTAHYKKELFWSVALILLALLASSALIFVHIGVKENFGRPYLEESHAFDKKIIVKSNWPDIFGEQIRYMISEKENGKRQESIYLTGPRFWGGFETTRRMSRPHGGTVDYLRFGYQNIPNNMATLDIFEEYNALFDKLKKELHPETFGVE